MGVTPTLLGRAALVFLLLGFALPGLARAEPTEAERMARWADLRHAIFGDRLVEEAGDLARVPVFLVDVIALHGASRSEFKVQGSRFKG